MINEDLCISYLTLRANLGEKVLREIFRRQGTLAGLVGKSFAELVYLGLTIEIAQLIADADTTSAIQEFKEVQDIGGTIVTLEDPVYPALLKEISDPPFVLYLLGNISCLNNLCIALVGARKASRNGEQMASVLATGLANANVTVISGFAYGIDISAHLATLKAGGSTVAVLGSGFNHIYPSQHKKYIAEICKNGCILSEFPLGEIPRPANFPMRNRIISGLSRGVVVVEASNRSGSLITARVALEQGRDVFAVPCSPLFSNNTTNSLIRNGAILVENANDIVAEYAYLMEGYFSAVKPKVATGTPQDVVYNALSLESLSADELVDTTGLEYTELAAILMEMELNGDIEKGGDARFIVKK